MLPTSPPIATLANAPLKKGADGWSVFALQGALNTVLSAGLTQDGAFGPATDTAVRRAQERFHLVVDGIAGPATKAALVPGVCDSIQSALPGMPLGLARNFARGEGGDNPAAVNWSVPGGVDCGLFQLRVFGPPYNQASLMSAFSPRKAGIDAGSAFLDRRDDYLDDAWVGSSHERAGRCAVMGHNWPAGAATIARTGKCSSPDIEATWARILDRNGNPILDSTDGGRPKHVRWPDGTVVWSRWQWCQFYAMGGAHGEGVMTKGVVW